MSRSAPRPSSGRRRSTSCDAAGERSQELRLEEALGWDRRPSHLAVHRVEYLRESTQDLVGHRLDAPEWVVGRQPAQSRLTRNQ